MLSAPWIPIRLYGEQRQDGRTGRYEGYDSDRPYNPATDLTNMLSEDYQFRERSGVNMTDVRLNDTDYKEDERILTQEEGEHEGMTTKRKLPQKKPSQQPMNPMEFMQQLMTSQLMLMNRQAEQGRERTG